jgi:hypothetical protein
MFIRLNCCAHQYSLASLIPGWPEPCVFSTLNLSTSAILLQNLEDCGSPPLAAQAASLTRAESLKVSNRNSLLNYLGLPLDLFGLDSFFQPYLALQQIDLLNAEGILCGVTNGVILQREDIHLKVSVGSPSGSKD